MADRTKWDILSERLSTLEEQAAKLRRELEGLDRTAFGGPCTKCGEYLATEGEFARHFIVPDARFLGLGRCPR